MRVQTTLLTACSLTQIQEIDATLSGASVRHGRGHRRRSCGIPHSCCVSGGTDCARGCASTHDESNPPLRFLCDGDRCTVMSTTDGRLQSGNMADIYTRYSPYGTWKLQVTGAAGLPLDSVTSIRFEFRLQSQPGRFPGSPVFFDATDGVSHIGELGAVACTASGVTPPAPPLVRPPPPPAPPSAPVDCGAPLACGSFPLRTRRPSRQLAVTTPRHHVSLGFPLRAASLVLTSCCRCKQPAVPS